MPTDLPAWARMTPEKLGNIRRQGETPRLPTAKPSPDRHAMPRSKPPVDRGTLAADAFHAQANAIRKAAATASHNTFRPEIFRVTEGYLN